MTLAELTARLTELELRYMEQQAVIDALDGVVREQDAEITRLAKELDHVRQQLAGDGGDQDASWDE